MRADFDFRGRMGREAYSRQVASLGAGSFFLGLGAAAAGWLASALIGGSSPAGITVFMVAFAGIYILTGMMSVAAAVRRLHDRGRSGWWLALAPALLLSLMIGSLDKSHNPLWLAPLAIAIAVGGWMTVELRMLRGDPGPNRFGDPPSEASAPSVVVTPAKTRDLDAELKAAARELEETQARLRSSR